MIFKTEAIILKSIKFGESSKIITFFTKDFGKISVIAKGSRKLKTKFGSSLEVMSQSSVIIHKKDSRKLQIISESSNIFFFPEIRNNLEKLLIAFSILEIVAKTTHEEEKNEPLFNLISNTLKNLDSSTNETIFTIFILFQFEYAKINGFEIQFENCTSCKNEIKFLDKKIFFDYKNGGSICLNCKQQNSALFEIETETFVKLKTLIDYNFNKTMFQKTDFQKFQKFLDIYFKFHFDKHNLNFSNTMFNKIYE